MSEGSVHIGVELGGTKVVVAGSESGAELTERRTIPTGRPEDTFPGVRAAIADIAGTKDLAGVGIASFGPIDLRCGTPSYGTMLETPKPGWSNVDVLAGVTHGFGVPIALDTDVNAAVLAEHTWGSATADTVAYITVGTGIGGGIWSDSSILHGMNHSEIGHLRVPRRPGDDFAGICPFHGDCLEGMASGTALRGRWGMAGEDVGPSAGAMLELEAWYLAHGIAAMCTVIPVEQVIVGGGVAKMAGLHDAVAELLTTASGSYPALPFARGGPEVLPPGLGDDAGVVGAIELARRI